MVLQERRAHFPSPVIGWLAFGAVIAAVVTFGRLPNFGVREHEAAFTSMPVVVKVEPPATRPTNPVEPVEHGGDHCACPSPSQAQVCAASSPPQTSTPPTPAPSTPETAGHFHVPAMDPAFFSSNTYSSHQCTHQRYDARWRQCQLLNVCMAGGKLHYFKFSDESQQTPLTTGPLGTSTYVGAEPMLVLDTRAYAPGSTFSPEVVHGQSVEQWAAARGSKVQWRHRPMFFFQKHSCDNAGHCLLETLYPAYVNMMSWVEPLCDDIGCDPFDSDVIMMENRVGNDCGCGGLVGCYTPSDWAKCEKNSEWYNQLLSDNPAMYMNELPSSKDSSLVECWSHAHAGSGSFGPWELSMAHWKHSNINLRKMKDMAYKRTKAVVETPLERVARVANDKVLRVLCQIKTGKRVLLGLEEWCNSLRGIQLVLDDVAYTVEMKLIKWEQTNSLKEQLELLGWTDVYVSTVGSGGINGILLRDDGAMISGLSCNEPGIVSTDNCAAEFDLVHNYASHYNFFTHWVESPSEVVKSPFAYSDQVLVPDRAMFRLKQATRWVLEKVRGHARLARASAVKRNQTQPVFVPTTPSPSPTLSTTPSPVSASSTTPSQQPSKGAAAAELPSSSGRAVRGVLLGAVNNGGPGLQDINTCQDAIGRSKSMIDSVSAFPEVEQVVLSKACADPVKAGPNITFMAPKLPATALNGHSWDPAWWSSAGWFLGFRFLYFLEFINSHPEYDYIVMADMFDVSMHADPIKMMQALPEVDLFLQAEWRISAHSKYMQQRLPVCLPPEAVGPLLNKPILNCGVWGGKRQAVLTVLESMRDTYAQVITDYHQGRAPARQCIEYGIDMSAFAAIVYRLLESKAIVIKQNEPLTPVYRNCRFDYIIAGKPGQPIDLSDGAVQACSDPHPKFIPLPQSAPMEEADGWVVNFCSNAPNPPAIVRCPRLPFVFAHKDAVSYQ